MADTLVSTANVELIEVVSEGRIAGFPDGDAYSNTFIDGAPLRSVPASVQTKADSSKENCTKLGGVWVSGRCDLSSIPGTTVDLYDGGPSQGSFTDSNARSATQVSNPVSVNMLLKSGVSVVRTISTTSVDLARVVIKAPALFKQKSNGTNDGVEVDIEIAVRPAPSESDPNPTFKVVDFGSLTRIKGVSTEEYYRDFMIHLRSFGPGPWDLMVRRVTADSFQISVSDKVYWDSYAEITLVKMTMPHTAFVKLSLNSKVSGSTPLGPRTYKLFGRVIKVPSNYTPAVFNASGYMTSPPAYSGVWDGTFKDAWTNNPAWVYYDLVNNPRFGLGDVVHDYMTNKWKLYTIAQNCDVLVSDGNGGQEPRFFCSLELRGADEAQKTLRDIATMFRALDVWHSGGAHLAQDVPSEPVAQYVAGNVRDGKFTYSGSARQNRITVVLVSYKDRDSDFTEQVEYVDDPEAVVRYGYNEKQVVAVGCISRAAARRVGLYMLYTGLMETDIVSFQVGIDSLFVVPGQVVRVVDPLRAGATYGGRLASFSVGTDTVTATIDRDLNIVSPTDYVLTCADQEGDLFSAEVLSRTGREFTAEKPVGFSGEAASNVVWVLRNRTEVDRLYRVVSIADSAEENYFDISAVSYSPDKYDAIDNFSLPSVVDYEDPRTEEVPSPASISVEEVVDAGVAAGRVINVTWGQSPSKFLKNYKVTVSVEGAEDSISYVDALSYKIASPSPSTTYTVMVQTVNVAGRVSAAVTGEVTTLAAGKAAVIPPVSGLELVNGANSTVFVGKDATFTWRAPAATEGSLDLQSKLEESAASGSDSWIADYVVRVYSGPTLLRREVTTSLAYVYSLSTNNEDGGPRRTFTVGVCARDRAGTEGIETKITVTNEAYEPPVVTAVAGGIESAIVSLIIPPGSDLDRVELHVSEVANFIPTNVTKKAVTITSPALVSGLTSGVRYLKAVSYDTFPGPGTVSNEVQFVVDSKAAVKALLQGAVSESELSIALTQRLNTTDAAIATETLVRSQVTAPDFSEDTSYVVDALAAYQGSVKRCTEATGPGAFNPAHWVAAPSPYAQQTVKVDVNGLVAGYGLASRGTDEGGAVSEFAVRVDKFSVYSTARKWEAGLPATVTPEVTSVFPSSGPAGLVYVCVIEGTTGTTEPTWPTTVDEVLIDGTASWKAKPARPFFVEGGVTYVDAAVIRGLLSQDIEIAAGGMLRQGKTDYDDVANAGMWQGMDGGVYKLRIGNAGHTNGFLFDGTDLAIARDTKLKGADAYNNDNIYYSTIFDSVSGWTTSGKVILSRHLSLMVGASNGVTSSAAKWREELLTQPTWDAPRRFKARVRVSSSIAGGSRLFTIGTGSSPGFLEFSAPHGFGFEIAGNSIRGWTRTGEPNEFGLFDMEESFTDAYGEDVGSSSRVYEAILVPGESVSFYVDGGLLGVLLTTIPSDTYLSGALINFYARSLDSSIVHSLDAYEARVLQE